jgi:hypothetical protein
MQVFNQLQREGYQLDPADVASLSPYQHVVAEAADVPAQMVPRSPGQRRREGSSAAGSGHWLTTAGEGLRGRRASPVRSPMTVERWPARKSSASGSLPRWVRQPGRERAGARSMGWGPSGLRSRAGRRDHPRQDEPGHRSREPGRAGDDISRPRRAEQRQEGATGGLGDAHQSRGETEKRPATVRARGPDKRCPSGRKRRQSVGGESRTDVRSVAAALPEQPAPRRGIRARVRLVEPGASRPALAAPPGSRSPPRRPARDADHRSMGRGSPATCSGWVPDLQLPPADWPEP